MAWSPARGRQLFYYAQLHQHRPPPARPGHGDGHCQASAGATVKDQQPVSTCIPTSSPAVMDRIGTTGIQTGTAGESILMGGPGSQSHATKRI
jgi:hypothetical protein